MAKTVFFVPNIGRPSETFIRNHLCEMLPQDKVVFVTRYNPTPSLQRWFSTPIFEFNLNSNGYIENKSRHICLEKLRLFLLLNNVKYAFIEFLNVFIDFIPLLTSLGIETLAHGHGFDVSAALLEKEIARKYLVYNTIKRVVTPGVYSKTRLASVGISPEKILAIPYGVHDPLVGSKVLCPDVRFLCVGRFVAKKNPLLTIKAFEVVANFLTNVCFDYVGAGPLFDKCKIYVSNSPFRNRIFLHGEQPHAFVRSLFRRADIYIQHSSVCPDTGDEEGLPLAILEAMSYKIPTVSTFHASIPEAILHGENGLLSTEGDLSEMVHNMMQLATNFHLRTSMGTAAYNRFLHLFTWPVEKERLLAALFCCFCCTILNLFAG